MDAWAKEDAITTYLEACRLAAEGHEGLIKWFNESEVSSDDR